MSEVRVNKLSPRSGTTVTLGDSGDTITIPSGVTFDASSGGLAGTLTTAAQPNITSVGTLTSFTSTGIDDNATSTAITIDSSENLLVGKTSANTATEGVEFRSFGLGAFTRSGNQPIIANRTDNNGIILELQKDGTQVGAIGTLSSNLYVGSLDTGIYFNNSVDSIYPINTTTNAGRDNAIDLGVSTTRFKDLYLSGGVFLGGTGTANKLDDYEEGTWTPVVTVVSGTLNSQSNSNAVYTKIGRLVVLNFRLFFNTTSASGITVSGLPFTSGVYSASSIAREWSQNGLFWGFTVTPSSTVLGGFRYDNNQNLATGDSQFFVSIAYKI